MNTSATIDAARTSLSCAAVVWAVRSTIQPPRAARHAMATTGGVAVACASATATATATPIVLLASSVGATTVAPSAARPAGCRTHITAGTPRTTAAHYRPRCPRPSCPCTVYPARATCRARLQQPTPRRQRFTVPRLSLRPQARYSNSPAQCLAGAPPQYKSAAM